MKDSRRTFARPRPAAFTLIELLVVIAIIAILAGMLFPAISGAMNAAKKAIAKNDAVQIANAVVMYETEYGYLPANSGSTVSKSLVETLAGVTTNNNPRKIVFLEVNGWKKGKGGTNENGEYADPWGQTYKIAMNTNYSSDGITAKSYVSGNALSDKVYRKTVVVWNEGKDENEKFDKRYFVNSAD